MVFSSVVFLGLFLPITLLTYFLKKSRAWRNIILLVASLVFYAWGEPIYIVAMIGVTLIDYFFGILISKSESKSTKKLWLLICVVLNLIPLFLFKYYNFFASELGAAFNLSIRLIPAAMPIGISFFTFQSMSYAIDIYRGSAKVQKQYSRVLLYVAMFPQLIAGPIVRYSDVSEALDNRIETPEGFYEGSKRFAIGLAKKVILANYAGQLTAYLMTDSLGSLTVLGSWLGIIMATLQLYFDFSGYSDMAIGLGLIFGFRFKENFKYPYTARSITDFWHRWHISMSNWFRDYVMYPIALSKPFAKLNRFSRKYISSNMSSMVPFALSTLITFSLIGFWHGADWNFLLWGVYHAIILIIEKTLTLKNIKIEKIPVLSNIVVLFVVMMGLVLFHYTEMPDIGVFLSSLFGASGNGFMLTLRETSAFFEIFWLFPIMIIGATPIPARLAKKILGEGKSFHVAQTAWIVILIAISFILLLEQSYNAFLYFRF